MTAETRTIINTIPPTAAPIITGDELSLTFIFDPTSSLLVYLNASCLGDDIITDLLVFSSLVRPKTPPKFEKGAQP